MIGENPKWLWRVGLTTVLSGLGLGILLFLSGNYHLTEDGYHLYVMFNYARGIEVGAPVLVSGVKVGAVEDVDFVFEGNRSRVQLDLWLSKKAVVKMDSKIYVKSLGLLGQPAIEITAGSRDAAPAEARTTLEGEEPFVAEEVLASARELVEGLSKAVVLVNSILEEAGAKQNIRATLENVSAASREFERAIRSNSTRIDSILISVQNATGRMEGVTQKSAADLEGAISSLKTSSEELEAFLQRSRPRADEVILNLTKVSRDLQKVTEQMTVGKSVAGVLLSDEAAAKSMRSSLKNIEALTKDVSEHPWKLLRKP